MSEELAVKLARNVKQLRTGRDFTQQQLADLCGVPRATLSNIESGTANPPLEVIPPVATPMGVALEELIATARADVKFYPRGSLPSRRRSNVLVNTLLPDHLPATTFERLELLPGARLIGVPHTPGTREYLSCESGQLELVAAGEVFCLCAGDIVVFRGDQGHSYVNRGRKKAVGYSVVLFQPNG